MFRTQMIYLTSSTLYTSFLKAGGSSAVAGAEAKPEKGAAGKGGKANIQATSA